MRSILSVALFSFCLSLPLVGAAQSPAETTEPSDDTAGAATGYAGSRFGEISCATLGAAIGGLGLGAGATVLGHALLPGANSGGYTGGVTYAAGFLTFTPVGATLCGDGSGGTGVFRTSLKDSLMYGLVGGGIPAVAGLAVLPADSIVGFGLLFLSAVTGPLSSIAGAVRGYRRSAIGDGTAARGPIFRPVFRRARGADTNVVGVSVDFF